MGVPGLTSYISSHSDIFLKDYQLNNCCVLIDGNAAASLIYSNLTNSNHAFGGDYDKYAVSVAEFIHLLKKCDIFPIFIFDGGYEKRKLHTIIQRIKLNVVICGQCKNKYKGSKRFPLLIRDVCKNVLRIHDIPVIQCDFEADHELVTLSKILDCPVISNDSDFYLSDICYIPFSSIEFRPFRHKSKKKKYYINCKMYNIDDFLNVFGGLENKSFLPLMSCALGNDYIAPYTFKEFLNISYNIKFEKKVEIVLKWIKNISCRSDAVNQMVSYVQEKYRGKTRTVVIRLLNEHNRVSSPLILYILNNYYFNKSSTPNASIFRKYVNECKILEKINNLELTDKIYNLRITDDENKIAGTEFCNKLDDGNTIVYNNFQTINYNNEDFIESNYINNNKINNSDHLDLNNDSVNKNSTLSNLTESNSLTKKLPNWFEVKFRCGAIPPIFKNIINFRRIFISSQSENYFDKPSHEIALTILQIIFGIVLGNTETEIKCHARICGVHAGIYKLKPICEISGYPLPNMKLIETLDTETRKAILCKCLNLSDVNYNIFPDNFQLFIIVLFYWSKNCKNQTEIEGLICAITVCFIYLNIIDVKIGLIRSLNELNKKELVYNEKNIKMNQMKTNLESNEEYLLIADYLNLITEMDCIATAKVLLHFHQLNKNLLHNRKEFNVKLVHSMAQFQHCIRSIMFLNCALNFPFKQCEPHLIYSGTFLYNFYSEITCKKSSSYYNTYNLLSHSGSITLLFTNIVKMWDINKPLEKNRNKLSKKKKGISNIKSNFVSINKEEDEEDSDTFIDPNNIYSLLINCKQI